MEENQVFYNFDNISLEGLHTHLFFGNVDTNSAYNACNFILKSNLPKFRDESPGIHAGDESRLTNS